MKSKLLVAAMVCLALAACDKDSKDKTVNNNPPVHPAAPAGPDHPVPVNPEHRSMQENDATHMAADDQNATAPQPTEQDMANKAQEMQQDNANTVSQTQGATDSHTTDTTTPTDQTSQTGTDHSHQ